MLRKWLYDSGLRNWYVARTVEEDDPCFIQGVVHPEENDYMDEHLKGWFPILRDDEILLEGAYAFQKYRGTKLCHMIATDIWMMYKEKGYKYYELMGANTKHLCSFKAKFNPNVDVYFRLIKKNHKSRIAEFLYNKLKGA